MADSKEALRLLEEGVRAGERALGKRVFRENTGDFWLIFETRPYMRVRFALALHLHAMGETARLVHNYNIFNSHLFFMKTVSRIILDPTILAGKPVIRGTRISVDLVLELLASGWQEAMILKEYPGLEHEDILACIRYAQEIVRSERVYSTSPQEKIAG